MMNKRRNHTEKTIILLAKQQTRDKERIAYTLTDKAKEALKNPDTHTNGNS